ncbi:MAG: hypothetical protein AAGH88_16465 [Planctomycetota bacterium]
MTLARTGSLLLACLLAGPIAVAQDATGPAVADDPVEQEALPDPAEQEDPTPREVTIGQPAPGTDPLAERDRPPAQPALPDEGAEEDPLVLGVLESELKIDPRTLGIAPGEPMPQLMREGEFIRNRDARLLPTGDSGHAVIILDPLASDPDADQLAMIVAPNRMLESMEALQKDRGENLRFTVSGQVHTYRGVNYLMITSQPRPWLTGRSEPEALPTDQPEAESPQDQASQPSGEESSSDDVLDQLLGQSTDPPRRLEPTEPDESDPSTSPTLDPRPLLQGVAPDQPEPKLYEEGAFIVNRSARLIRSGDGARAVLIFDADNPESPEPPMIIQNCKLLEQMESIIAVHGDHVPFIITGQVQVYRGTNYILPSIGKLEFERNNLE